MTLATNRSTANTPAEHVADHNTAHGIINKLAGVTTYWQAGDTDWTAAFGRIFADSAVTEVYVPPSATPYDVSSTLTMPIGQSMTIAPGATIRAVATIAGPVLATEMRGTAGQWWRDKSIRGGTIDCNGFAQTGLSIPYALNVTVADLTIKEPTSHGVLVGDTGAPGQTNEVKFRGVKVDRTTGGTVPTGSFGIWVRNAYDSSFFSCTVVGAETSFRNDKSNNKFIDCHGWGWAGHLPVTIFDDLGAQSTYIGCAADTPSAYGFRIRNFNHQIVGCTVYNNTSGSDNVIEALHYDQTNPFSSVVGMQILGADASHRLAKDINITLPVSGFAAFGVRSTNVVLAFLGVDRTNVLQTNSYVQPNGGSALRSGLGTPNAVVSGTAGDFYFRTNGGAGTYLYFCTGGTAWTAVV